MIFLFPYHSFVISTTYSPLHVKIRLTSLLKKNYNNNRKIQVYTPIDGLGKEEFSGVVEEGYFDIKRYRYSSSNFNCMCYKGTIESTKDGSILHITFRFDILVIIILLLALITMTINLYYGILSQDTNKLNSSIITFILMLSVYIVFMIGFNYRTSVVKELLMKKLNSSYLNK